ncbi:canalicular multispecific organic anion transporter 1 [Lindgomyces ingoldianus]|uniref:Canalicular multispecific organic anion transporter 1 n=1 Tax=Lindgomyces ingoldianus TaxID=673940 RepID=A0ACB6R9N1_9PLEO|nr:canalicular multispecific organic anion transporter 1 [Lindgomyces ingoldianus]KAF2475450.1 canalicular multispecific organic anion transporter 1 [Lindgomyces ingoldianus]
MASNSSRSCVAVDDSFGPYAGEQCRGGFDFTLLFEDTIFCILPLILVFCMAPFRIFYLRRKRTKVSKSLLLPTKLLAWCFLAAFDLSLLILWLKPLTKRTSASVASAIISVVGALVLCLLSYFEHLRSVQTSFLLNVYLLVTVVFDAARSRSFSLDNNLESISVVFTTRVGIKVFLAIFEAKGKRSILLPEYAETPLEATSGIYSRAFFWWQIGLFRQGFSNTLSVDNLFQLDKHLRSGFLLQVIQSAWEELTSRQTNSLFALTLKKLKWPLMAVVPPRVCLIAFNFCQPFLIHRAIAYSQQPDMNQTSNIGYGLIGAYVLVYVGIAISTGQYQHLTYRAITMIRGGMISMLYKKAMDIDLAAAADPASSLTLMSADVERIVQGMQTAHEIWANFLEVGLAIYLLERQLGAACAIPIAVAVVSLVGSLGATSLVMQRQALWLEAIERRIAATSAMLGSMKGVKMCGLTDILRDDLQHLRVDELEISKKFRKLLIWTMGFSYISPIVSPILTFAMFSVIARNSSGHTTLDTSKVFTSLSLFSLLSEPLGSLIMALAGFMGGVGSFQRIQDFLSAEPRHDARKLLLLHSSIGSSSDFGDGSDKGSTESQKSRVSIENRDRSSSSTQAIIIEKGFFGWDKEKHPLGWLQSINIIVPRAKLTMVVGPVGCGKSTLLKAVLGELPVMGGLIQLSSLRIALCDQTPWHINGTVQQSIVGVSEFDQRWYASVVRSCALDDDLCQLPAGDQTQIGSKGIALSGGQSQRIALARAVYAQKDIIILDDCLSGLDTQTENKVWHSLFGRDGLLRRCRSTVLIASSSTKRLPYCDHIVALDSNGRIAEQGGFDALNRSGGYISSFDLPQPDWDFMPEKHFYEAPPRYTEHATSQRVTEDDIQAEANRRTGDTAIYLYYVRSVGWIPTIIFIVSITIFIFGISFPTMWVKLWASYNVHYPNGRLGYYLGIYSMLGGIAFIFLIVSCWQLIITMVPRSGVNFHWKLLTTVLHSPMTFFSTTDTGVTLNRFSQDLQLIDMELPVSALNTFATFVLCIGQMTLIAIASPFAAISFPVVFVSLYLIQKFYLRTSRQLRFLDLETKSPLYTQFTEILSGLATVRAFGWQSFLEEKARDLLDRSQRPFYLLFAVQRWLTLVLDLVVAVMAVLLIILVVTLRGKLSAGYVGVALLNVILFSQSVKLLISFWTQLETHIGSVARIKTFTTDTMSEDLEGEDQIPPPNWPSEGRIEFRNISACYHSYEPVIKKFSLSIKPGEKVAIVGRTGSGKSSLVLTLFRMLDLSAGSIHIDSIHLHHLPRQTIRTRLIGLPQDAYLLPGSVRLNADPPKQSTDKAIMQALKDVQLWDIVVSKGDESKYAHPLDVEVEDLHFSHGQRQLFCLARAILKRDKGNVVVLDEATSSVDAQTDSHIQKLLRSKFTSHTIIAVAHKLETILDFDKVAVMHHGQLVEYGEPYKLLDIEGSWFKGLYEDVTKVGEDGSAIGDVISVAH